MPDDTLHQQSSTIRPNAIQVLESVGIRTRPCLLALTWYRVRYVRTGFTVAEYMIDIVWLIFLGIQHNFKAELNTALRLSAAVFVETNSNVLPGGETQMEMTTLLLAKRDDA